MNEHARKGRGLFFARSAFSLLELVIVMAILASIAAVAWPRLQPGLNRTLPKSAAVQIKSDLMEARDAAIRRGEVWLFRYQPGTDRYEFGPLQLPPIRTGTERPIADERYVPMTSGHLPFGAIFPPRWQHQLDQLLGFGDEEFGPDDVQRPNDELPATFESTDNSADSVSWIDWQYAVEFQPEGRANQVDIPIIIPDARLRITVHLRGLTGAATVGAIEQILPPQERELATDPLAADPFSEDLP